MSMQITIHEASKLLREKKISSVELTQNYLERIKEVEPKVMVVIKRIGEGVQEVEEESPEDLNIKNHGL